MNNRGFILLVDDEEDILVTLKDILEDEGYRVDTELDPKKALKKIKENDYDLVISDLKMPNMTGEELLEEARKFNSVVGFIMLTAYGTIESAVKCVKNGAFEYLSKPLNFNERKVWETIENSIEKAKALKNSQFYKSLLSTARKSTHEPNIIINNETMEQIIEYCQKIANFDFTVLVYGESGVGKELIAKYIHQISYRSNRAFLPINCATIPKDIMEAEFFGAKKGVYTGADTDRVGIIEQADGGTLFLDEISELPLDIQAKFLRFIQEKEVRKIGDVSTKKVDVRVICATNKDLYTLVKEGKFREDLYFRLEGIKITIPPLRERREDIPLLVYGFLEDFNSKYNTNIKGISLSAMELLVAYQWEGNVRQLQNVINEACILAITDELIEPKHLPRYISGIDNREFMVFDYNIAKKINDEVFTKKYLKNLLTVTRGNISKAAKIANIERQSLQKILKKYGIDASEFRT
ncbi:MAG: sigma-54 dependent transcriptional regulator [Hydrogenothermaceae bacterium]|nr:sigma-54 dependent transcriptional regulator [Hydrogenothermaceae bacterium]